LKPSFLKILKKYSPLLGDNVLNYSQGLGILYSTTESSDFKMEKNQNKYDDLQRKKRFLIEKCQRTTT